MMMVRNTFHKKEKLTNLRLIRNLFTNGKSFFCRPLKINWKVQELPTDFPAQVVLSTSKRNFKNAVDRNKIKRLLREAYRQNKSELYTILDDKKIQISFSIIYTGKSIPEYHSLEKAVKKAIKQLTAEL